MTRQTVPLACAAIILAVFLFANVGGDERQATAMAAAKQRLRVAGWGSGGTVYDRIQRSGPWFLGTCTGTKGSGAWLREWIELQILGGVDHVWVVDDNEKNSTDITGDVLRFYANLGYVTIIPGPMPKKWPGCELLRGPPGEHNCIPPKYCFHHAAPHVNWLLFADTDEFFFPHNGCSLSDHIRRSCNPYQSHIQVRWERFGTSGFVVHPQGLMTENFLSSGGDCHNAGPFYEETFKGHCARHPFSFCGECRHFKVIYNTKHCCKEEHAGWIHWPVNTTDWKEGMNTSNPMNADRYYSRVWPVSEGNGSNWKSDKCVYRTEFADNRMCERWLYSGGGSTSPVNYDSEQCCAAGIGYNHYGTKSLQYYVRKLNTRKTSKRGFRAPLESIDLDSTISVSALRFVRALRQRFKALGLPISDSVKFTQKCFVESPFRYVAKKPTTTLALSLESTEECCDQCYANPLCTTWTYSHPTSVCTLILPSRVVRADPRMHRNFPYHTIANRVQNINYTSGVPLRDGECSA
eukprot:TRINITY_DN48268_c0_g1_i1.p1 TRINITY_DN48268_c0_g1~~TRINITY_DN48268_c0_g1_i1.p1  ORF type:complete len:540 (+),score=33.54 TRINITY_DN48268_c0_g1_i1:59-1621(+)